jgi:hypothetical protein
VRDYICNHKAAVSDLHFMWVVEARIDRAGLRP